MQFLPHGSIDLPNRSWEPLREDDSCFLRRRSTRASFGLNGAQFFGLGYDAVRTAMEAWPDSVGTAVTPEDRPERLEPHVRGEEPLPPARALWNRRNRRKRRNERFVFCFVYMPGNNYIYVSPAHHPRSASLSGLLCALGLQPIPVRDESAAGGYHRGVAAASGG